MSLMDPRKLGRFAPAGQEEAGLEPGRLAAVLDFGASKTVCLIGRVAPGALNVAGIGVQKPQTGSDGAPIDFDACVRAIRIAMDKAERMAGDTVSVVTTAFGGRGLKSERRTAQAPLPPGPIGPKAVRAVLAAALADAPGSGRVILHAAPWGYRVDDGPLLADPRGAEGRRLSVEVTLVTAPEQAVAALVDCIAEAGLRTARVVASPYAAALAVLSPEECVMGAVALDFGAAHVGVAAFSEGGLVLAESAPVGGAGLTADIAARIGASFAAAERVKILHGGFCEGPPPEEPIEAPRIGPDGRLEPATISRGSVIEAMGPRLEEMLAGVRARLAPIMEREGQRPWRAALTGGGAQLSGLRDLAQHVLERPVRLGRPVGFGALDEGAGAMGLTVAAGLLRFEADPPPEAIGASETLEAASQTLRQPPLSGRVGGAVGKAWSWLKENF
jgi:cell division protein FtsA